MKKNIFKHTLLLAFLVLGTFGCKDQLDVGNPNAPTIGANVDDEAGIIALASGGAYINGFQNGDDWLGDSYFSLPWGYAELLADLVGADASNNQVTTIGIPDYIVLDDGTQVNNSSSSSVGIIRAYNNRAATGAGNNAIYYQWLNMYAMNNASNVVLSLVDKIPFTGDAETKSNTIKAWAYWWKGYAYASIGSMYVAGVIANEAGVPSNEYVSHEAILAESDTYFNMAASTLSSIGNVGDYTNVLARLIPAYCQVGNGGVLSIDMWKRNINTMLARNIMLNKLAPFVDGKTTATITGATIGAMTPADWTAVKNLAANGIQEGDFIFTGRTTGKNDFFTAALGSVAALTSSVNTSSTFKISERFVQNFKPGDKRFENNFVSGTEYKNNYTYTTRWTILDGGAGLDGVYVYASQTIGEHEVVIAGSFEENALILAEANIRLGSLEAGLALIDDVRDYMGAGLGAVAGTGLDETEALTELTRERRVALMFRGLSFYDNRRYGWSYAISKGGGSYGNTVVESDLTVNTDVTISYNFMDYWDVPADEFVLNPPSETSVEIENSRF